MYYHTTSSPIVGTPRDLCVTPDLSASRAYVHGEAIVYAVELADGAYIADESDIADAVAELGGAEELAGTRVLRAWEAMDIAAVREALAESGYAAARYRDQSPDNEVEHETVRILDAGAIASIAIA